MAGASTISITFKVEDEKGGFKKLTTDAEGFNKVISAAVDQADQLHKNIVNWSQASVAARAFGDAVKSITGVFGELTDAYNEQIVNETKLANNMRNTMGASDDVIQSIKDLCSAQQELGVVGDEVQLAGAQEMATYLGQAESLKTLIPVMNDMIAQQYGLSASSENAASIATMLGKVMQGQTGALSRYGYTFDEAQEKVLKFGTEEERAAVLASVVEESVGGMNRALAETDAGKAQQVANEMGDYKEMMGQFAQGVDTVLKKASLVGTSMQGILQIYTSLRALKEVFLQIFNVQVIGIKVTNGLSAAWKALRTSIVVASISLSTLPIGWLVAGLAAVVGGVALVYSNFDKIKDSCKGVAMAVKPLWDKLMNWLAPAFEKVGKYAKKAWDWIKKMLGIDDPGIKGTASDIDNLSSSFGNLNIDLDKYLNNTKELKKEAKAAEGSLEDLQNKVSDLQKKVNESVGDKRLKLLADLVIAKDSYEAEKKKLETQEYIIKYKIAPLSFDNERLTLGSFIDKKNWTKDLKLEKVKLPEVKSWGEQYREAIDEVTKQNSNLIESTDAIGTAMGSLGDAIGGAAGKWLEWGSNVVSAIGKAIPQIIALMTAEEAEGSVAATSAAQKGASSVAGIPFIGPSMAVAAVASIVAALTAIPKFADGAIAFGPTLGLFGEYSGARSNPEVVAPLDRLRTMIGSDGGGGTVEFRIQGKELVGIFNKQNRINSRNS